MLHSHRMLSRRWAVAFGLHLRPMRGLVSEVESASGRRLTTQLATLPGVAHRQHPEALVASGRLDINFVINGASEQSSGHR